MPDTTNPIGFTDANELREKNRATVEKYMNTKGQDRLRRHELFVEDGCANSSSSLSLQATKMSMYFGSMYFAMISLSSSSRRASRRLFGRLGSICS